MQTITPNLWFDGQAEEAANFYVSVFKNSKIGKISHFTEAGFEVHKRPAGSVMVVEFELNGQPFMALNGGPLFKFSEALSLVVPCENQAEIDTYWDKLSQGGDPAAQQCGWLKDKYGLSWQITPAEMTVWMSDQEKAPRVMNALLEMKKLDIEQLKAA